MTQAPALRLDDHDAARWVLPVTMGAVVGALALRVFGLPGVDLHGPLHRQGIMDPLSGGTRATYALSHGDLSGAWSWNPLVVVLAAAAVAVVGRVAVRAIGGRWVNLYLPRRYAAGGLFVLLLTVEVNQQLQADRLMTLTPG